MIKEKISVEIGHIYQDMELDNNYLNHIIKSQNKLKELNIKNFSLKILIDDLNIENKKWDIKEFVSFLKEKEIDVDFIFFESKFVLLAERAISELPSNKLKWETFRKDKKRSLFLKEGNKSILLKTVFETKKESYSCALLSSIWQLCRLNYYNYPENSYIQFNEKEKSFNKSISILEKKYQKNEENVELILNFFNNVNLSLKTVLID